MFEMLTFSGLVLYCLASILAVVLLVRPAHFSDKWILSLSSMGCAAFVAALLVAGVSTGRVPLFGRFEAISCYCVAVTLAYIHLAFRDSMRGLSAFLLPYITALLVFAVIPTEVAPKALPSYNVAWLAVHVGTAFFGYGFFTVASALALSYLVQDFNLKHKRLGRVFERLPSLETSGRAMRRQVGFAFVLFTVSLIAGVRLAHTAAWQTQLLEDPKIVTVLLTWVLYACLLFFCAYAKKHGRRIAQITIAGLFLILFSFIGIHALTDSAHNFVMPRPGTMETSK